ncbi:MAG TPA: aldo/keto reductase [Pseudonocardiaceae bacterium]|jgi:aryl-alcohol dehydrogenase-like predicted oxidoreductase
MTDTIDIGSYTVNRLGYGAMRITGPGIWGYPPDRDEALRVLRRAVELGVNFIDTADSYGPYVSEELIRAALHPYPDDLLIGTKAGLVRTGPDEWHVLGDPKYLRQEVEMSLRRLGLERIGLFQLHRVDPRVPLADQLGELRDLQREGKINHIGLSEVDTDTIEKARRIAEIVSVQNLYNLTNRAHEKVVDHCEREGIAFIPWNPVAVGQLAGPRSILANAAKEYGATPGQVAVAWLLRRSPVMVPIPGTGSVAHLEENLAATDIELSDDAYKALSELA